jgi:hypothetical protein
MSPTRDPIARAARDVIWAFPGSRDAVTVLELMRSAELECVPLTPKLDSGVELILCRKPVRMLLRDADGENETLLESREALDTTLTPRLALEVLQQLRSSSLWRTVRAHIEQNQQVNGSSPSSSIVED